MLLYLERSGSGRRVSKGVMAKCDDVDGDRANDVCVDEDEMNEEDMVFYRSSKDSVMYVFPPGNIVGGRWELFEIML